MTPEEKRNHYLGLSYNVVVNKRGGKYVLFIRELNIRHEDASLEKGFEEVLRRKDAWLSELCAEGQYGMIVLPGEGDSPDIPEPAGLRRKLAPFFIKLASVSLVLLVMASFASSALRDFGYNMEKKLDKIVQLKPEEVEAHQKKAHFIAERLRPIMLELMTMFRPEPQAPEGQAGQTGQGADNATRP